MFGAFLVQRINFDLFVLVQAHTYRSWPDSSRSGGRLQMVSHRTLVFITFQPAVDSDISQRAFQDCHGTMAPSARCLRVGVTLTKRASISWLRRSSPAAPSAGAALELFLSLFTSAMQLDIRSSQSRVKTSSSRSFASLTMPAVNSAKVRAPCVLPSQNCKNCPACSPGPTAAQSVQLCLCGSVYVTQSTGMEHSGEADSGAGSGSRFLEPLSQAGDRHGTKRR